MAKEFVIDPFTLDLNGGFPLQVNTILEKVRLSRNEVDGLSKLFFDVEATLQRVWQGCQVMPFGSIITGLGISSSDVDCYVQVPQHYKYDPVKFVIQARNIMRKRPYVFHKPFAITTAKVPIVKLYHVPTGRHCDINFKSASGVRNSEIIAFLLQMDVRALPLSVLIKYWSKVHKLTGTNLLANYALTMMIIFFMQQKNILPAVYTLQILSNDCNVVDKWNTAFSKNYIHKTNNNQSLYELLGDFFMFYSKFDFSRYIISPFTGTHILREQFMSEENVPNVFSSYKTLIGQKSCPPINLDKKFCIQDVFEHNRNSALSVSPEMALRLKAHFDFAAKMYTESDASNFLRNILCKSPVIPKLNKGLGIPKFLKTLQKPKPTKTPESLEPVKSPVLPTPANKAESGEPARTSDERDPINPALTETTGSIKVLSDHGVDKDGAKIYKPHKRTLHNAVSDLFFAAKRAKKGKS